MHSKEATGAEAGRHTDWKPWLAYITALVGS